MLKKIVVGEILFNFLHFKTSYFFYYLLKKIIFQIIFNLIIIISLDKIKLIS